MANVTWNEYENFDRIMRYDDSADVFTEVDNDATDFDYFDDNMTAGDFIALVADRSGGVGGLRGTRRRNIKINVGTAVSADSVVIKLQYNKDTQSNWEDIADVTSYFTSTGEKTIEVEPPDRWSTNYFSSGQVGGARGWVYRFLVESVTNPTEGGSQTTDTIQGGNNTFYVSNVGGLNPMKEAHDYDVANDIGIISRNQDTYVVGKSDIYIGGDNSSVNLDDTNVVFDGSDNYGMYLTDVEVSWVKGFYTLRVGGYEETNALVWFRVFQNIDGIFEDWSFAQSGDSYSTMDFTQNDSVRCVNTIFNVEGGNITLGFSEMIGVSTTARIRQSVGTVDFYNLVCGNVLPFYAGGVYVYESDISSGSLSTYASYTTNAHVDCNSSERQLAYISSGWSTNQVLNTYQVFVRDESGDPVDDALVKVNQTSINIPNIELASSVDSTTTRLMIRGNAEGQFFCRNSILKVNDELMRVVDPMGGGYTPSVGRGCIVERGVLGSTAAAHSQNDTVDPLGIGYFYTGYVDWDKTERDFLSSTAVNDSSSITVFDNQPISFTKLVVHIDNIVGEGEVEITGTDFIGRDISEKINVTGNGYYVTVSRFASITQVDISDLSADLKIGLYGTFYPLFAIDNTVAGGVRYFYEDYQVEMTKDNYKPLIMKNVKFKQKTLMEATLHDEATAGISSAYVS